jgi:CHAD domain-containing protein
MTDKIIADVVYGAIQSYYVKMCGWEADAIADRDPEAVHQMRVNLRKSRSIVGCSGVFLDLPSVWSDRSFAKLAKVLGKLRDCDVAIANCQKYRPDATTREQEAMDVAMVDICRRRRKALERVRNTLASRDYQDLKLAMNQWLNEPRYSAVGDRPCGEIVPDLLLPVLGKLFCHPAWWLELPPDTSIEIAIPLMVRSSGDSLHDLRKQVKATRYVWELFPEFYDASPYKEFVEDLKQIQTCLGDIQDCRIFDRLLLDTLSKKTYAKLETIEQRLSQTTIDCWQTWAPLQHRYRDPIVKTQIRGMINK